MRMLVNEVLEFLALIFYFLDKESIHHFSQWYLGLSQGQAVFQQRIVQFEKHTRLEYLSQNPESASSKRWGIERIEGEL